MLARVAARLLLRGERAGELCDGLAAEFDVRASADHAAAKAWYRRQVHAAIATWWRGDNREARTTLRRRRRLHATTISRRRPPGATPSDRELPRTVTLMERIVQDLRYASRTLLAGNTFAYVAIAALALGTGGATAIFTLVDAVVLRPLPYADAHRIMAVWETSGDWMRNSVAAANFLDWRASSDSFETLAASNTSGHNLTGRDEPLRLSGIRVTGDFFATLGVDSALGRAIVSDDDADAAEHVAVASHGFWSRVLGSERSAIGQTLLLDGGPHTLVGVMPPGFSYPLAGVDVWTPMRFTPEAAARRNWRSLRVIGRLSDGVSESAAHDEMVRIAARLSADYPEANENVSANVIPLRRELLGNVQSTLVAMATAVGLLLLIACVNVANLLLVRATGRHREIAVRAAIGASPARIRQLLMVESVLLAFVGAALGLALAVPGARFLTALIPAWVPLADAVRVDYRAVVFCLVLVGLTTILFGMAPARRAARTDLSDSLRGSRIAGGDVRTRQALIVTQLAIAIVLLIGAGLLIRSFAVLASEDLGFDADPVLRARVQLVEERYPDDDAQRAFFDELLRQVDALPGVESAAMVTRVPLGMSGGALIYTPFNQPTPPLDATYRVVTPGYFKTLGIELQGRDFAATDAGGEPVVIIGEELARRHWPDQDAIGQTLKIGDEDSDSPWLTVIGVTQDVRQWNVEIAARPAIYVPASQGRFGFFAPQDLVVKVATTPSALARPVRTVVQAIDPELPVASIGPLADVVDRALARREFKMRLLMAFAAIAALVAGVGLYGVLAYMVESRTRELGIRKALGAGQGSLLGLVVGKGLVLVGLGSAFGLAISFMATRVLAGLLYEVSPLDPVTFVAVPVALGLVAIVALAAPARRALRIDPMSALRAD